MYEYQLEAEYLHEFMVNGAKECAYPSIVGGGENACILHYSKNTDLLKDGDLVLVDAGLHQPEPNHRLLANLYSCCNEECMHFLLPPR